MLVLAGPTSAAPTQPSLAAACAALTAPLFVDFMAWVRYTVTSALQALCERATSLINRAGGVRDTTARPISLAKVGSVYIAEDSRNRTAERYRDFVLNAEMTVILAQAGR
jgi:hypothetical protein